LLADAPPGEHLNNNCSVARVHLWRWQWIS
jgi:hypothetical protein